MRYTEETKCGTPGCGHVFKSVAILYGTVANARCPKCNSWMTLPLKPEPTRIPVGEPKKIKECEQCASTQSLRTILKAAQECNSVTHLGTGWIIRECEAGLKIGVEKPVKFF